MRYRLSSNYPDVGLDEDNCRVVVKLSISSAIVSVPQAVVKVVSRKVGYTLAHILYMHNQLVSLE